MLILDTNVVSEPMRPRPEPKVLSWLKGQDTLNLFLTAAVLFEVAFGIERLPKGRRRTALERWLDDIETSSFQGRILPFDHHTALVAAKLAARAGMSGHSPDPLGLQIAAVAIDTGMLVVTRNRLDFERLGVSVINPWETA